MGILRKLKTFEAYITDNTTNIKILTNILKKEYVTMELSSDRNRNPKRLNKYGYKVYSQNFEDGIIAEIFKRVGTVNEYFVEFGVGNGLENNTAFLLLREWSGYWMECEKENVINIEKKFSSLIEREKLLVNHTFVNKDNIEELLEEGNVPKEFDLLSIDIDGNDYWIWQSVINYFPRVVVIEYNAYFPPDFEWIMEYDPDHRLTGTNIFGASLKALERLGTKKGYKLVGCDISGTNAFFVRNDLVKNAFLEQYTSENHYEYPYLNTVEVDFPK